MLRDVEGTFRVCFGHFSGLLGVVWSCLGVISGLSRDSLSFCPWGMFNIHVFLEVVWDMYARLSKFAWATVTVCSEFVYGFLP